MKKEEAKISRLYSLENTIAKDLFEQYEYPWEVLEHIGEYIVKLGKTLPLEEYDFTEPDIWIHKSVKIPPTASITGPCIICEDAEIRHCCFIRGKVIIGKGAVAGNSCEFKNSILFDKVQTPHYNYVGDSVLGYMSHMGAASLTSNVKSDKSLVVIKFDDVNAETGLKKVGGMIGDKVEVGCASVLNPGSVIGKESNIYPLSSVRKPVNEKSIYKNAGEIARKR